MRVIGWGFRHEGVASMVAEEVSVGEIVVRINQKRKKKVVVTMGKKEKKRSYRSWVTQPWRRGSSTNWEGISEDNGGRSWPKKWGCRLGKTRKEALFFKKLTLIFLWFDHEIYPYL